MGKLRCGLICGAVVIVLLGGIGTLLAWYSSSASEPQLFVEASITVDRHVSINVTSYNTNLGYSISYDTLKVYVYDLYSGQLLANGEFTDIATNKPKSYESVQLGLVLKAHVPSPAQVKVRLEGVMSALQKGWKQLTSYTAKATCSPVALMPYFNIVDGIHYTHMTKCYVDVDCVTDECDRKN